MKAPKALILACVGLMVAMTPCITHADDQVVQETDAVVLPTVVDEHVSVAPADATVVTEEINQNTEYSKAVTAKLYQTPDLVLSENLPDKVTKIIVNTPSPDQFVRARDLRIREQVSLIKRNILPTIASVGFFCTFSWIIFRPH